MTHETIELTAAATGQRLDMTILEHIGDRLSRAQLQALIASGQVSVNGRQRKAGVRLKGGEHIILQLPSPVAVEGVRPERIALTVLYEDEHLAVVEKPAGMIVHPGDHDERGTLVAAALARWPELATMPGEPKRAGIVHRLDKDTSGLVIVARQDRARRELMRQFQERQVKKRYLALLERCPSAASGRIDAPVGRDPKQRKRMAVVAQGRPSISDYNVLDERLAGGRALVEVRPLSGRTHQIRVHMAHLGCPIVGDSVYGLRKQRLSLTRQFLHAAGLKFTHPASGAELIFESALPPDLQFTLESLHGPTG